MKYPVDPSVVTEEFKSVYLHFLFSANRYQQIQEIL